MNKISLWGGKEESALYIEVTAGIKAHRHESAYFVLAVYVCVF